MIAAYRFGNPDDTHKHLSKAAGRTALSKALKQALIDKYGSKCFIYLEPVDENELQVDHRIPYEIVGEQEDSDIDAYMLLCPSANRAKSWTCEHCDNWETKDAAYCLKCFWAFPEDYEHIANMKQKIIQIVFTGDEIEDFNRLIAKTGIDGAQEFIKRLLRDHLE